MFDLQQGDQVDPHAGEYILPSADLQMCWKIMGALDEYAQKFSNTRDKYCTHRIISDA